MVKTREHTPAKAGSSLRPVISLPLLITVTIVVYANAVPHDFVFDDRGYILSSPVISGFKSLSQIWFVLSQQWRPVTQLSYALTYYFAGFDATIFHLTNVCIHIINSLLIWGIARKVASRWLTVERAEAFALAAGLIHAVHPMYTEAVSYVWGRSSSLCALFYFGSLLLTMTAHEETGRKKYMLYAGAILSGVLAWKTKEEAISLPLITAAYFALAGSWRAAAAVSVAPLVVAATRWKDLSQLRTDISQDLTYLGISEVLSPANYFFTHVKALVFDYIRLFLLPFGLNVDHDVHPVASPTDPLFLISTLLLVCLAVFALRCWKGNRALSFALLAFLVSPLTVYSIMPLADVVAEHRAYIAGLSFDLLAAWLVMRKIRYAPAALVSVALLLGILTMYRNNVWANNVELWKDAALKSPNLVRPHMNLGSAYEAEGKHDAALEEYQRALSINPRLSPAYNNIGEIHLSRQNLEQAETNFRKAAELSSSFPDPLVNLGLLAMRRNRPNEALQFVERARALKELGYDYDATVVSVIANIYLQSGRFTEAEAILNKAIPRFPQDPRLFLLQGAVYEKENKINEAEGVLRKVLTMNPNNALALNYLGFVLADHDVKLNEAASLIEKAVQIDPNNGAYFDSLGWTYFKLNKLDLSEQYLTKAVGLLRDDPSIHDHLGDLYFKMKRLDEARAEWMRSVELSTDQDNLKRVSMKLDDLHKGRTLR